MNTIKRKIKKIIKNIKRSIDLFCYNNQDLIHLLLIITVIILSGINGID